MPHAVTIATPGLQALILCGPGSSFPTFTANPDENPKALLPIANRPMVWYPLEFCYRAGITNITLVCPPSAAKAITTALNTNPFLTSLPYPRPDLLAPKDLDQNTGTAEILRLPELQAAVTSDFLVLPCDLVCELGADKLLQAWMVKSATLEDLLGDARSPHGPRSGGLSVWYQTKTATPVKGEETDFMATVPLPSSSVLPAKGSLFPHMEKLVYSMPTDSLKDLMQEKKGFPVRHGLLRKHPRVRMLTTHRDAHLYIFPHWVMQFIKENERLESIGEDVIGWWAKAAWQQGLSSKLGLDKILGNPDGDSEKEDHAISRDNSTKKLGVVESTPHDEPNTVVSIKNNGDGSQGEEGEQASSSPPKKPDETPAVVVPPMLAYIHPSQPSSSAPLIRRVDTTQLLLQISLQLAKLPSLEEASEAAAAVSPFAHPRKVAYPEGVRPRTTITQHDSLLADNVTVQERAVVRESVVGAGCQIGEGARLTQCLLMDGAVVGRGCRLTRCVLGRRSEVGEGCVLTECEVQENLLVEPRTEAKDEKFMSSSGLEATEQELDAIADDDGIDETGEDEGEAADD
ncbi:hypothetical protein VTK56DRAFT_6196 [Thermocarpiscus australiensis]